MLAKAAEIVNSTPLFDPPESPYDLEPITPQQLITQRDNAKKFHYSRPTVNSTEDILAFVKKRWKRVEVVSDELYKRF